MKYITLKLSIYSMILLSTILFSCNEEPPVRSGDGIRITNSATITYNDYLTAVNDVGTHHNECMDTLYNKLLRIKNEIDPHPQDSINDFIYNEVINFAEDKNYDLSYIDSMEVNIYATLSDYLNSNLDITEEAFNMLSDLDSVFNEYVDENMTLVQFNQYCDSEIPVAYSLDSLIEKYIVGATLMVAKYTINYWTSN